MLSTLFPPQKVLQPNTVVVRAGELASGCTRVKAQQPSVSAELEYVEYMPEPQQEQ